MNTPRPTQPDADREAAILAPYAFHANASAGRVHPEPPHPYRPPFQRDRDRIIHCAAWRRLSEKMQVFTSDMGDYHRTRITHTLEVTLLARTLGRALALNEDLIEALALLHDIGHPPFGHAGEDVLRELATGGEPFEHNAQALRIVEKLERRYPDFPGLNLSREILDGQRYKALKKEHEHAETAGEPHRAFPSPLLEVQLVDVADSVSYDSHDADDAIELGLIKPGDLEPLALWRRAAKIVSDRWTALDPMEFRRAVIHALIDLQVGNILATTRERLNAAGIDTPDAVRERPILVGPDAELALQKKELEAFLHTHVYRHSRVIPARHHAASLVRDLFSHYLLHPDLLPQRYRDVLENEGDARAVADYIADLTDRSARIEHTRLLRTGSIKPRTPLQKKGKK